MNMGLQAISQMEDTPVIWLSRVFKKATWLFCMPLEETILYWLLLSDSCLFIHWFTYSSHSHLLWLFCNVWVLWDLHRNRNACISLSRNLQSYSFYHVFLYNILACSIQRGWMTPNQVLGLWISSIGSSLKHIWIIKHIPKINIYKKWGKLHNRCLWREGIVMGSVVPLTKFKHWSPNT